jgi:hypothetical protein
VKPQAFIDIGKMAASAKKAGAKSHSTLSGGRKRLNE